MKETNEDYQPKWQSPAFPILNNGSTSSSHYGLTKRELFAAMAMQGIIASPNFSTATTGEIAAMARMCADDLLGALAEIQP